MSKLSGASEQAARMVAAIDEEEDIQTADYDVQHLYSVIEQMKCLEEITDKGPGRSPEESQGASLSGFGHPLPPL